jgi:F-type H+-transporting ATPase subunit delta
MDRGTISRRYAKALLMYAQAKHKEKQLFNESSIVEQSFMRYPALARCLSNRVLPAKKKEELIHVCAGGNISEEFKKFIHLIIKQKREALLQLICLDYQQLFYEDNHLLHVVLITAHEIDKETAQRIVEKIEKMTKETVHLQMKVDPGILGGFITYWDTYRLDASVKTALKQIQKKLTDKLN